MMAFRARPVLAVAGSMLCVTATVGASAAPAQASASASAPGWRITKILNPKYDSNLLNVIAGFSTMVAEELTGLAGEDARLGSVLDDVKEVRDAGQRAITLTRQLLIFARSDVVHPEVLSLNDIKIGRASCRERVLVAV